MKSTTPAPVTERPSAIDRASSARSLFSNSSVGRGSKALDFLRRSFSPGADSIDYENECPCGNYLSPDAVFCWRCGHMRAREENETGIGHGAPLWTWSQQSHKRCAWWPFGRPPSGFRFIDRSVQYGQSEGLWGVRRVASKHTRSLRMLYAVDWFHTFLDGGTTWSHAVIFSCIYIAAFLFFAVIYLHISDDCNLQIEGKLMRAYYLSLETMMTIGFGVPDPYYNNCGSGAWLLTAQAMVGYFLNALVVGTTFVRLTRPQARANTILFSDKAVIQQIGGSLYFMFQVCEANCHELAEANIRCFCIRHDRKGEQTYQVLPMRLEHPDDTQGSKLMLTLPTKIVHRIDNWSPLSPCFDSLRRLGASAKDRDGILKAVTDATGRLVPPTRQLYSAWAYSWPEVARRQVDSEQGCRDGAVCSVCGDSFATVDMLRRHAEYNAAVDARSTKPEGSRHKAWTTEDMKNWGWQLVEESPKGPGDEGRVKVDLAEPGREEVQGFLAERYVEVIVLVEGDEPSTSSAVQARHSYLFPDDVMWDRDFAGCVFAGKEGYHCAIDLDRFQELVHAPSSSGQVHHRSVVSEATVCASDYSFGGPDQTTQKAGKTARVDSATADAAADSASRQLDEKTVAGQSGPAGARDGSRCLSCLPALSGLPPGLLTL